MRLIAVRISADPRDQGFSPAHYQFRATLNGMPVPHALTADEELGLVRVVTNGGNGEAVEHVLFGRVRIERVH